MCCWRELGFNTPFYPHEIVEAICIALGTQERNEQLRAKNNNNFGTKKKKNRGGSSNQYSVNDDVIDDGINVFPPNMPTYTYEPLSDKRSMVHGG
jgi:hypothetical protein